MFVEHFSFICNAWLERRHLDVKNGDSRGNSRGIVCLSHFASVLGFC